MIIRAKVNEEKYYVIYSLKIENIEKKFIPKRNIYT